MANGTNYNLTKGKNFYYPKYLKKNEVDPLWIDAFLNTLPQEEGQKYLDDVGLSNKVTDIRKEFDAGRLKMYSGMSEDAYNALGNEGAGISGYRDLSNTTGGYHKYRTAPTDTARIMINPKITGRASDTVPHEFWHEVMGHTLGDEGQVPELSGYDKLDKASNGRLPFGNYITERQAIKKYGDEAPNFLKQIYEKDYHPKTTGVEFERNIGDPWLNNMSPEMRDQIYWQEFPMKHKEATEATAPLTGGDAGVEAVKNVRGWMKKNIPWMKRGEGWLPDNIYKQGNWFGDWDPNLGKIFFGDQ